MPEATPTRTRNLPGITIALAISNLAIWLALSLPSQQEAASTIDALAFAPERLSGALERSDIVAATVEIARSVSSIFVHSYDVWHVGLNMAFLVAFGCALERRLGKRKYAVVYAAAGILTCAVYFAICPDGKASFGASSAVCGVLGAYLATFLKERPVRCLVPLAVLVLNLIGATNEAALAQTGFGFWAHLSGFAIGTLTVAIMTLEVTPRRPQAVAS